MSSKTILIAGGAGFIGSHVAKMLALHGYQPVIFDNLSSGSRKAVKYGDFIEGDLANKAELQKIFEEFNISAVMHFAALIDVGESVTDPAKYYANNVTNTLILLETMRRFGVKSLIFSSSAAIFGLPQQARITEEHVCQPINPYGETKLIVEKILRDYDMAYGIKSSALRYFNAAGGDPSGEIKNYKHKETNLIPLVLRSLMQADGKLTINGTDYPTPDGTCIRDYIHIEDLGLAHILALQKLLEGGDSANYNLGNGNGFSIREVIHAAETITHLKVNVIEGPRRAGDPPILIADSQKARRELGWVPRYSNLETIVEHAWLALH